MSSSRTPVIDALRGIALFGILAVNIQSFSSGVQIPSLGLLDAASSTADDVTVVATALLFEYKFYPIFCFCFGYGFAIQVRKWVARGQDARGLFTRRVTFMLLMGILHGALIWFGDILSRYAVTAFILRRYLQSGPRKLIAAARLWFFITLAVSVFIASAALSPDVTADLKRAVIEEFNATTRTYTHGTWLEITLQRIKDFNTVSLGFIFLIPQVMLLFLLGALTAQMGWLRHPEKWRALWWRVFLVGAAIGIPCNFAFTDRAYRIAINPGISIGFWQELASQATPFLSAMFVAALALSARTMLGRAVIALFAPAGRFALTNYLLQSTVLSFLLYGYGLGLGAQLRQSQLLSLACALYAAQLLASHLYQRMGWQGPMEALWRRFVGEGTRKVTATANGN
jgi:uncharacterized protein